MGNHAMIDSGDMGRKRAKDRDMPARVYRHGASWYFVDRHNKWHRLGRDKFTALSKYADIMQRIFSVTIGDVMDDYIRSVLPTKAIKTQREQVKHIGLFREVFGHMQPGDIKPAHIYRYMAARPPVAANREVSLLSRLFQHAIRLGHDTDNPCRKVDKNPEKRRDRYIEDWEFNAVLLMTSEPVAVAMVLAYLTGLRKGDLLALKWSDVRPDGIHVATSKTDAKLTISRSETLSAALEDARVLPSTICSFWVIHSRTGQPYTSTGFGAIWQRLQRRWEQAGGERFTFHDIRRKAATDLEFSHGREAARKLLGHTTQDQTATYIGGPVRVDPVK